jgi:beta-mannosidase
MYSDCWGEIGWTIIDYYLRRKPSFYFVKRAFKPVRTIIRKKTEKKIAIRIINDLPVNVSGTLTFGFKSIDGEKSTFAKKKIEIKANWIEECICNLEKIKNIPVEEQLFYAIFEYKNDVDYSIYFPVPFNKLKLPKPELKWKKVRENKNQTEIEIESKTYCHAVHFKDDGEIIASDNYFDLIPGIKHKIVIYNLGKGKKPKFQAVLPKR